MKILYIDCSMGASGDMLAGALLDLSSDSSSFIKDFNKLNIPGVSVSLERSVKCGICGSHFNVCIEKNNSEGHSHFHLQDLISRIDRMNVSEKVKTDIRNVYALLADAESKVHNIPVNEIHLHEVGELDALADISSVCILLDALKVDKIIASPVHVGSGQVQCAHGILPVPAPATALLLKGIPVYGKNIQGELCTPTGAALLKYFVSEFSSIPEMQISSVGYGMGTKDFERPNCVRMFCGISNESNESNGLNNKKDCVTLLECNIDDMSAEDLGYAQNLLLSEGALDVYTTSVQMKKNRNATLLSVICKTEDVDQFVLLIFRHTSTLGIREQKCSRFVLDRKIEELKINGTLIRKKISSGYGVCREKFEHSDLVNLSQKIGLSLEETRKYIEKSLVESEK